MGGYVGAAGIFLISVVFGLYILAVMLRLLFQLLRADFYNPISQAIVKLTNPPLLPLRRIIPGLLGIDLASIVLLIFLQGLELFLVGSPSDRVYGVLSGVSLGPAGIIVFTIAKLFQLVIYVFIVALIIQIIMSWVNPHGGPRNPALSLIHGLTEPLLRPARRLIPPISGLDLSPIIVFVVLQVSLFIIVAPLKDLGITLF